MTKKTPKATPARKQTDGFGIWLIDQIDEERSSDRIDPIDGFARSYKTACAAFNNGAHYSIDELRKWFNNGNSPNVLWRAKGFKEALRNFLAEREQWPQ